MPKKRFKRVRCVVCLQWFASNWINRHQEEQHFMPADQRKIRIAILAEMGQTPEQRPDVRLP